ncbi:hypothetical protein S1OALGB6SA_2248 [Olavius algarvensis spirochete endosymbiont]|uniref:hypothetical protein n=1 Tax=Olavius algarvensis spirochete endosymbiont TaxID=260710 RepID=UPI000F22E7AA|nr:hypothetical protein [Olavius algarvensis spirochete endosymbiont]VDB01147.1 hypothetical protein S1OALGB6SA_2248 [Olavius algarvensis spirochete endosymbiont]
MRKLPEDREAELKVHLKESGTAPAFLRGLSEKCYLGRKKVLFPEVNFIGRLADKIEKPEFTFLNSENLNKPN